MVLFFDIDGTLLDHTGRMPESAAKGLKQAKANGHKLILCSGRSKCGVRQLMERFQFDGCVCSAGAYVEYRQQIVNQDTLKQEQRNRLIDFFEESGAVYGLQCSENIVCPSKMYETYEMNFRRMRDPGRNRRLWAQSRTLHQSRITRLIMMKSWTISARHLFLWMISGLCKMLKKHFTMVPM